jgi:cation transporter-like permease
MNKIIRFGRPVLLLAALALIAAGIVLGQYSDVLAKATVICLECIGIG